jgi:3-phenylpropionate/trans-cinnamate dioxygenase ferredoxin subunit
MTAVKVNDAGSIAPGQGVKIETEIGPILVANVGGTLCAIANTCPHQGGDLSRGTIAEGIVTCPKHGSQFDLRTGRNVRGAKILFKTFVVEDARAYPVTAEGADLFVEIG